MPDYPAAAARFWWGMAILGALVLGYCLVRLALGGPTVWLHVALATLLAALAGLFPIRVPGTRNSLVVGEVFSFLVLLMHGAPAAAVVCAGEAAVGSYRTSKRWSSRLLSPALGTLAMFAVGSLFDLARAQLAERDIGGTVALLGLGIAAGMLYFPVNATLFSGILRLKRGEPFFQLVDVISVFRWLGMAYAGSAAVAVLLHETYRQVGPEVLAVMLPLLLMLLVTLHYFFRQQEDDLQMRERATKVAAREATLAAREAETAERHLLQLRASERRFHSAFTDAGIGMALVAAGGRIVMSNPALHALFGRDEAALAAIPAPELLVGEHAAWLERQLAQMGDPGFSGFREEACGVRPDGQTLWLALHGSLFRDQGDDGALVIVQAQDITARRVAEAGLQHLAYHDPLTGLPNRRRFVEVLAEAVAASSSHGSHDAAQDFAVMFIDFDRFKLVNDSLGHSAGDDLLVQLARRIQERLRPSDTFARLGGDEFALLALGVGDERSARLLAARVLQALDAPFQVAGHAITTTASIGITFSRLGYGSAEDMLRDADTAMYKAKVNGKARVAIFDRSQHAAVSRRLRLEGELRRALGPGTTDAADAAAAAAAGGLSVAYQPVFDLERGHLTALEALVRWRHPSEGALPPADFLPVAEESGIMRGLSDFVLGSACRQLSQWQQSDPTWAGLGLAVNVSGEDLTEPRFVERVTQALVRSGLRAEHLTLELTEDILMSRIESALPALAALRRLGVQVAVDDFGTGYSSLSHLAKLPIDALKIDRSFVAHLHGDSDEAAVVRSIVELGRALRKSIVAEGIESAAQVDELRGMGCALGQGYHLGMPQDAAATTALLHRMKDTGGGMAALH